MVKYFFRYKWHILVMGILIVIEPSINAWMNFWVERVFNEAVVGADVLWILRLVVIGFCLWMSKRLVIFASTIITKSFLCSVKLDIKSDVFRNIMQMDTADISSKASSGEYMSVFVNDIVMLEQRYLSRVIDLITSVVAIIINGMAFIHMNIKLAIPIMIFGVMIMFFPAMVSRRLSETHLIYSNRLSSFTQKLKELLIAYPTIKNYAVEKQIMERFDRTNLETEEALMNAEYELNLSTSIGAMMSWFMQIIGIGLGLIMVIKGEIVLGTVIAVRAFANDLAQPLQNIVTDVSSIRSIKGIADKMDDLSSHRKVGQCVSCERTDPASSDIVFHEVCLSRKEKAIINGFSYRFEPGKKYLIVGENGSGKSTLFKILTKRIQDFTGSVTVQGKNIQKYSSDELSGIVSYLSENVYLLTGSVMENISLYRNDDHQAIRAAAEQAQVRIDLSRIITDGGNNISSGEQRRIEIARSMLSNVDVLIFDEVVSTLDIKTAYEIEKMVLGFSDKTVIFISHNFSGKMVREYDEILVMENGSLIAHGPYEKMIETCAYFREICMIKFGSL